jgi:hypothetical protein
MFSMVILSNMVTSFIICWHNIEFCRFFHEGLFLFGIHLIHEKKLYSVKVLDKMCAQCLQNEHDIFSKDFSKNSNKYV